MAALIRSELSHLLLHEVADPRLREVVITEVDLSRDLRNARVYVAAAASKDTEKGLRQAMPFFRRRLGDRLELKYVPVIEFRRDEHGEQVLRVQSLIEGIKKDG